MKNKQKSKVEKILCPLCGKSMKHFFETVHCENPSCYINTKEEGRFKNMIKNCWAYKQLNKHTTLRK